MCLCRRRQQRRNWRWSLEQLPFLFCRRLAHCWRNIFSTPTRLSRFGPSSAKTTNGQFPLSSRILRSQQKGRKLSSQEHVYTSRSLTRGYFSKITIHQNIFNACEKLTTSCNTDSLVIIQTMSMSVVIDRQFQFETSLIITADYLCLSSRPLYFVVASKNRNGYTF